MMYMYAPGCARVCSCDGWVGSCSCRCVAMSRVRVVKELGVVQGDWLKGQQLVRRTRDGRRNGGRGTASCVKVGTIRG